MLNNKNDLSMIPTINNDGNSYIIPMDMYKEGYWAYNISNYFKARVDDNGTPFMIRWYKHGQLANVLNLRPFIRGRVGGYTIDDSNATADPKIVMDENASSVDWTGETTDTQAGGIAIYRTINQCYPQDGIFYGQVGLRSSDGDTVVTGIDIIFKVLDGNVNMLGAKKYYVSELTKALLTFEAKMDQHDRDYQAKLTQQEQEYQAKMDQNDKDFKSKTDQVIADARAAYTKETQNTHDALVAAQAQIQANRDEQADLSNRLAGTEQQIKIHNVATLDQFATLSKQALERLSSIGAQPKYYDTVDAMKSANPNGTNDLCETVDDGHRWLYINGVWQDCGAVQDNAFKAARDASQDILYGQDIRNWEKGTAGTIVEATEEFAKYQDKPIIHLKSVSSEDYTYVQSGWFSIKEPTISIQFPEMVKDLSAQGIAKMEIHQLKATEDQNDSATWNANTKWIVFDSEQNSNMKLFKFEDLNLNPDTVKIQIRLEIQGGTGSAYVGTPLVNIGSRCIAYSPMELAQSLNDNQAISFEQVQNASQNLLYGQNIRDWSKIISGIEEQVSNDSARFHDTPIIHIKEIMAGEWNHWTSDPVKVEHDVVSLQLPNMVQNSVYGATTTYISVIALKPGQKWDDANVDAQNFSLTNAEMGLSKFENIKLPSETDSVVLDIVQQGVGDLYFGIPVLNYGSSCIPYDPTDVANSFEDTNKLINDKFNTVKKQSFNLLYAGDIQQWTSNIQGNSEVSHEANVQFDNLPIIHMSGDKKDIWNHWISPVIPVKNLTLSLQIPEKQTGQYGASSTYISVIPLAKGEKYTDNSAVAKTLNLGLQNHEMSLSKFENIKLPEDTVSVVLDIVQQGIADLYFSIPVLNYGSSCIPYDPLEITRMVKGVEKQSQDNFAKVKASLGDLLFGEDITHWSNTINGSYTLTKEEYEGSPIIHMSGDKKDIWNHWVSPTIPVNNLTLSLQIPEKSSGIYGSSSTYIRVIPLAEGEKYGDDSNSSKELDFGLGNAKMGLGKFENIKLPDNTISVVLDIVQQGISDLYFGKPVLNYGPACIAYNHIMLTQQQSENSAYIARLYICSTSSAYNYSSSPVAFKLIRSSGTVTGYLNFGVQGDSSRAYTKKNMKLKLFKDDKGKEKLKIKALASWPKTNKYNLKANWIDATQSRNIVNARLIKDAVAVTPLENPTQTSPILSTEGLGQIDGFPIEVYFYDGYHGLYTLNTKKDETTFGMDSKEPIHEVLSNELPATDFTNSTYTIDGKNWVSEIHDQPSETIKTNLKKFQDFVNTATDEDFKAHIRDYIDVKSVINHILYGQLAHVYDYDCKSELLATWNDGVYWYLIPYDLDATWGLYWDGRNVTLDDDAFSLTKVISDPSKATKVINDGNKLHERIFKLFKPEFKTQGQALRSTVWSTPNLIKKFKLFIDSIPELAYKKDEEFWSDQPGKVYWDANETHYTGIPSLDLTSFGQLQQAIIQRGQEFDQFVNDLSEK